MQDNKSKEQFGLKIFHTNNKEDYDRECQILNELQHKFIIKKIENENNQILLELCSNGNIFSYINNGKPWPDSLIRYYFKQLIQAVKYAHQHSYAHRDIKL